MKKWIAGLVTLIASLAIASPSVLAMSLDSPSGTLINGWYKDGFAVQIHYGTNPQCLGQGTANTYTFTAGAAYNGSHNYVFAGDTLDNPYLSLDGGSPQLLITPPPCPASSPLSTNYHPLGQIQVDAQAPAVSITNPASNVTVSSPNYLVSGVANDAESGLGAVDLLVNGTNHTTTLNGNVFSAAVTLNQGTNTIVAKAFDKVGHSTQSSTVVITYESGTSGGGSGTSTGGSSGSNTSSGNSTNSSTSGTNSNSSASNVNSNNASGTTSQANSAGTATKLKFNQQHVLSLSDSSTTKSSDPGSVLADQGFGGAKARPYYLILLLILLIACGFIIWRFKPIFSRLDRDKKGLRRRIIMIVSLPSLLPLFGLGFLGYQQITHNVRAALSDQLAKAAQTSALKLEREFAIRTTVITKSAGDILQIKSQIADQHAQLSQQRDKCAALVNSAIPKKQYASVTSSDDCLPFLTGFAQLASSTSAGVKDYLSALDQGKETADDDLTAQEQQRINELLGAMRHYFPDLYELTVVGADDKVTIEAELSPGNASDKPVTKTMNELLKQSRSDSLTQMLASNKPRLLLMTFPISQNNKTIGGALAAINIDEPDFVPDLWRSTPKPYASNEVLFITSQGDLLYPTSSQLNGKDLAALAVTAPDKVANVTDHKQKLATRVSQVTGTNLAVAVGALSSSVLAPLAGVQQTALLAIASFILLSVILGFLFVSGVAGEIERLVAGALHFDKGELDFRIGLKSNDELQTLSDTMDQMAADIKAAQTALIEKDKEFINVATHELKAPMTAILGNLSMITEDGIGQVDDQAKSLITEAYDGTVRLRSLVSDMLDVARLEAGKAQFKLEPLDTAAESAAIVKMQSVPAQQAGLKLVYQPAENLPKILADKTKFQIILTNFVSNAIKYNRPNGSITVSQQLKDGLVETSVVDTGLGIPADQQAHIFEKFYRVAHDDRKNVPGTGLGMYITKSFIEAMGGRVWFESVHGQGTTFHFTLPVASQTVTAASPAPNPATTPQPPSTIKQESQPGSPKTT